MHLSARLLLIPMSVCVLAVSSCGEADSNSGQAEADKIVADAKAEAAKIKKEAASDAAAAASSTPTPPGDADTGGGSDADASSGRTLPNFRGKGLQYSQDESQAAGFYALTSHDALGRGREQILDRNWKVCTQTPSPGSRNTSATVDFGTVKIEEDCPSKDQGTGEVEAAGDRMPKLTGKSAAVAEESLPGASIDFEDGTGGGRSVILASNWRVCGQDPAAGEPYSGVPVTLTVVKFGEGC